uniref:KIND domain-containing protein n=1 Tax=Hucho hucho TaxID=62062 RepID=A0A4W5KCZ3_9TELE
MPEDHGTKTPIETGHMGSCKAWGGVYDLNLEDILSLYSQPINEEQAWAVCYQCCRTLTSGSSVGDLARRIEGPGDVRILRDGTVQLHHQDSTGK